VPEAATAHDLRSAVAHLKRYEADDGGYCMILGALNVGDARVVGHLKKRKSVTRTKIETKKRDGTLQLPCFVEVGANASRRWMRGTSTTSSNMRHMLSRAISKRNMAPSDRNQLQIDVAARFCSLSRSRKPRTTSLLPA
jgi:hypothetical protein